MNSLAMADAIAARFAGITAGGESLASVPTARLPNTIGKGPVILVYPPTGTLDVGTSARRNDLYTFEVKLLRDPSDVPARTAAMYAWFDAMHDRIGLQMQLGLSYVSYAEPVSARLELDGEKYAGAIFDVVELTVEVLVNETVSVAV